MESSLLQVVIRLPDLELDASDLKKLAEQFKAEYKKQIGEDFPSDPKTQLYEAIRAVFRSWDNPRAPSSPLWYLAT